MAIRSFADRTTAAIFHGVRVRACSNIVQAAARRKLLQLDAACELRDLRSPPGNRLELLTGDLAGFYSIRVDRQYRLVFRFADGTADAVRLTDYH